MFNSNTEQYRLLLSKNSMQHLKLWGNSLLNACVPRTNKAVGAEQINSSLLGVG